MVPGSLRASGHETAWGSPRRRLGSTGSMAHTTSSRWRTATKAASWRGFASRSSSRMTSGTTFPWTRSRSPPLRPPRPVTDGRVIRVLVADDEPLVRRGLKTFITADPSLTLVGEARNGPEAVELIRTERPELAFLDVQMPELDGFGVLDALEGEPLPAVVFVTAYDEYAIRAFEVHAVDYLLKPFDEERFRVALGRARSRLGERRQQALDERLEAVLSQLRAREQYADRLLVKSEGRVTVVQVDDRSEERRAGKERRSGWRP